MSTTAARKIAISGPGLKKEGIIVLQFFFIGIFSYLELLVRNGFGIITGIVIMLVTFGGVQYGRNGTSYVAAVNPPLAFAALALVELLTRNGLSITRLGIDFLAALASQAPFLLISAAYAWYFYFDRRAKAHKRQRAA
jgi:hypothetical protein